MTTSSKQITRVAAERGITRDEAKAEMQEDASILNDVLNRMETIEARQSRPSPVHLKSWEEIERFAEKAARSGMVPKDFIGKADAICIAIQMGSELGLPPMQALQNIAVVNGRPSIWGDAMPALCRASGVVRSIREWSDGDGDNLMFYCEAIRKDDPNPVRGKFGVLDAKRAGLWKETPTVTRRGRDGSSYQADSGPWYSYPHRMLQMRARGFCLRDAFPDVLRGLISAEEAADMPFEATGVTPRVEPVQAEPAPPEPSKPKMTVIEWLKALDVDLTNAQTSAEVDAILARDDVQKAQDKLQNGARDRLQGMLDAAIKRTAPPAASDEVDATEWDAEEDTGGIPADVAKSFAQVELEAALARTAKRKNELDELEEMAQGVITELMHCNGANIGKYVAQKGYKDFVARLQTENRKDLMIKVRDAATQAATREQAA